MTACFTCSTKDHEYAKVDGKTATCGITNFAQSQLGDVVYVSLPEVGAAFKKGCVAAETKLWLAVMHRGRHLHA